MIQMAMNHDCANISALPAEVKKLQQMNEKLFVQLQQRESERIALLTDTEFRNGLAKQNNPVSMSPDSSGKSQMQPTMEDRCGVQCKSSDGSTSVEAQSVAHSFINPLDYSIHSRQVDATNRSSTHISPAMKSGSSGTSNIGSFSSSSSPSPSLPDNCTGHFVPQRQPGGLKSTRPFGAFMSNLRKTVNTSSDYRTAPGSSEILNEIRTKRRGRLKKDIVDMKLSQSMRVEMEGVCSGATGHNPLTKKTECLKASIKRHTGGSLSSNGGSRTPASAAAYKYLTWREKDRRRRFREEWKHLWLVIPHGRYEVMCLVCHKVMTQRKLDTIKRHTVRRHVELLGMAETERKNLFDQLIRQHSVLGCNEVGQTTTLGGMRVGRKLTEPSKSNVSTFSDIVTTTNIVDSLACYLPQGRTTETPTWQQASPESTKRLQDPSVEPNPEESPALSGGRKVDVPENLGHSISGSCSNNKSRSMLPQVNPTLLRGFTTYQHRSVCPLLSKEPIKFCSPTEDKMSGVKPNEYTHSSLQTAETSPPTNQTRSAPFPDLSVFYSPPYLQSTQQANKYRYQLDRPIENLSQTNPMNMTFLHILEQLAASRSRLLSGHPESSPLSTKTSTSQCSAPVVINRSPELTSGCQLHPTSGMNSKHSPLPPHGSRAHNQSANPCFKYSRRKVDQHPATSSVQQNEPSSSRKSSQPTEDHTPITMAVPASVQSGLHLPLPLCLPSSYLNYPNQLTPPTFNPELMMSSWRSAMSSAASSENLHRPEVTCNTPSVPPGGSSHLSRPAPQFSGHFPFSLLSQSSTDNLWSTPAQEHIESKTDRKHLLMTNSDLTYLKNSIPSRGRLLTRHEIPKNVGFSTFPQPWSSGVFTHPKTVPMCLNKSNMSEYPKSPKNFPAQSPSMQALYKTPDDIHTQITSIERHSRNQTDEHQTMPISSHFENIDCPACHWTGKSNDRTLDEKEPTNTEPSPTDYFCSSSSLGSPGTKDGRKTSRDGANKFYRRGTQDRIPATVSPILPNLIQNPRLQSCDYFDKLEMRTSLPFWLPPFRPQPNIYSRTPNLADPTFMLYYSELLRQYAGASQDDRPITHSFGKDPPLTSSAEKNKPCSGSNLGVNNEHGVEFLNVEVEKNNNTSKPSTDQTGHSENECCARNRTLALGTQAVEIQTSPSPKTSTQTELPRAKISPVEKVVFEGTVPNLEETQSTVQSSTKLSPIWAVDLSQSTVSPDEMLPYASHPSAIRRASIPTRESCSMVVHMLRLGPKQDLQGCLSHYIVRNHLEGAFIMTCCGNLERVRLRLTNNQEREFRGPYEIVSLVGTVACDGQSHLHATLANADGQVFGGHLLNYSPVYATVEIVLGITGIATFKFANHSTEENACSCDSQHSVNPVARKRLRLNDSPHKSKETGGDIHLLRDFDDTPGFNELTFRRSPNDHS